MWTQRELSDGTFDFQDLLDAHDFLDWKEAAVAEAADRARRK
jgi:hypothetical protein